MRRQASSCSTLRHRSSRASSNPRKTPTPATAASSPWQRRHNVCASSPAAGHDARRRLHLVPQLVHGVAELLLLLLLVVLGGRGGRSSTPPPVPPLVSCSADSVNSGAVRRGGGRRCRLIVVHLPPLFLVRVLLAPPEVPGDAGPPAPPLRVELKDEALLVGGDAAAAEARVEVVHPPEAAALAGALETCTYAARTSRTRDEEANGGDHRACTDRHG
jgi:hypothetical protein